jgi:hypothetical protein
MNLKTKTALAAGFVLAVGIAATAFGQGGGSTPAPAGGTAPAGSSSPSASVPRAQRQAAACGRAVQRPRARRVVHADLKIQLPRGGFATATGDRGTITAVDASGKSLTIKRADDQTVTVTATDATKICKDGKQAGFGELKVGDFAGILQVDYEGRHLVRRIVDVSSNAAGSDAATLGEDLTAGDPSF